jgi:4-amino-4-deoxy-L-arabinose transferase-like glycosyltransferase
MNFIITFLKSRWVLLTVLCVFIVLKLPHLSYPYYWDESWPYATALRAMYTNGVSLLPNAMDADISRGHPLLFHVLAAGWMKVFGVSHVALHSFALLISVAFLVVIYEAGLSLFNDRVAIMALLLVASQEVFFIQSSFVLLEVLVALLCFLSLWCYATNKHLLVAIFLTLLFYTKESGLILGAILGLDALVQLFGKNTGLKEKIGRLLSVGVPCILIALFFLIQKYQRGWYIFPLHSDIIEGSWNAFWYKFRMCCVSDVFYNNLKFYYFLLLGVVATVAAIRSRKWVQLAIWLPIVIVFYYVDDMRAGRILPSIPFFIVFVLSWFWLLRVVSRADMFKTASQRRFIVLAGTFVICFLCFSAMNYYTCRYLLAVLVPVLFLFAVLLDAYISLSFEWVYYVFLAAVPVLTYFAFTTNHGLRDTDRGAFDAMDVQQDVVNYLEQHGYYEQQIAVGSFLEKQHLLDPTTGFLRSDTVFKNVRWDIDVKTELVIFDNIEADNRYDVIVSDTSFQRVHRYSRGVAWAEIYMRK